MDFVDKQTGFTGNSRGKLYQTVDAGDNWMLVSDLGDTMLYYEIDFVNENKGIALIGEQYSPHAEPEMKLFYTLDGGLNWTHLPHAGQGIIINTTSCCLIKSEYEIYIGAVNGIFYSADFGNSWDVQYTEGTNIWVMDIILGNNYGIVTTGTGKILRYY